MRSGERVPPSAPAEANAKVPDFSQEGYVIEKFRTTYRFENDGTGKRELYARIKVGLRIAELQKNVADRVVELENALSRVKKLQGLLPICSYCKKVRDDRNYWQQVDSYISKHTEVEFSHGICPDCYDRLVEPQLQKFETHRAENEA